jgi:hypothetical protein
MDDAKNYHAWAHRQALVAAFAGEHPGLWAAELRGASRLLRADARNNSAWAQRAFVVGAAPEGAVDGLTQRALYDRCAGRQAGRSGGSSSARGGGAGCLAPPGCRSPPLCN